MITKNPLIHKYKYLSSILKQNKLFSDSKTVQKSRHLTLSPMNQKFSPHTDITDIDEDAEMILIDWMNAVFDRLNLFDRGPCPNKEHF